MMLNGWGYFSCCIPNCNAFPDNPIVIHFSFIVTIMSGFVYFCNSIDTRITDCGCCVQRWYTDNGKCMVNARENVIMRHWFLTSQQSCALLILWKPYNRTRFPLKQQLYNTNTHKIRLINVIRWWSKVWVAK